MKNFIVFGAPGAGKGTQATLLAEKYGFIHLSSGEILRKEIKSGELGETVKKYLAAGRLVPGKLINTIMEKEIKRHQKAKGLIFDGFPRTLSQAKHLNKIMKLADHPINAVFKIRINEEEGIKRILERAKTSGRSDDNEEIIKKRFKIYHREMHPILSYYHKQNKLIIVDGHGDINDIFKNLTDKVKKIIA
ncbi:MAG: adenylate kinase [Patescibacteria group bacterium]